MVPWTSQQPFPLPASPAICPSYCGCPKLITEEESESDHETPSLDVSELIAEEVTTEKVTAARTNRKRSNKPFDSQSSNEENTIHNKSASVLEQLEKKIDSLHADMAKHCKQLQFLNTKMTVLETKVGKLQRDVSFLHSQSMQGALPKDAFYPSVVTDETRPSPVEAASAILPQSTEEDFKM